jgi:4-hydroxybenzoate polyprenyltransferase
VRDLFTAIRLKEIIGKCGFFLVGIFFAAPAITLENIFTATEFFVLCLLNGIAIYLINAGFGYQQDHENERLNNIRQFKSTSILISGFTLLVAGLLLLYLFSDRLLLPALIVYLIWIFYSLPGGLKGIPLTGLMCAFIGQVMHFHVGFMVFLDCNSYSLLLSIYFALLFSAGHALHEVIDHDADQRAKTQTSAVYFGKQKLLLTANALFIMSAIYFISLAFLHIVSWRITLPYVTAFIIQQWLYARLQGGKNNEQLFSYRREYMTAYLLATVAVILVIYLK